MHERFFCGIYMLREGFNMEKDRNRIEEGTEEKESFSYDYDKAPAQEEEADPGLLKKSNPRLLTIIQITACAMVLLAAIVLKAMGGEPYEKLRQWYLDHLNRSLVAEERLEDAKQTVISMIPEEIAPPEDVRTQAEEQDIPAEEKGVLFTHAVGSEIPVMLSVMISSPVKQEAVLTSGFEDTADRGGLLHKGLDLAGKDGDPICAVLPGTVEAAAENDSYGKYMIIDHGGGIQTLYAHCSELLAKPGASVERGGEIARMGSTGDATGTHLHFELRVNGQCCDPAPYLSEIFC